jgi:hypothetical protein
MGFNVDIRAITKINKMFSETKNCGTEVRFCTSITNEKGVGLLFPIRQSAPSNLGQECEASFVLQFAKFTPKRTF